MWLSSRYSGQFAFLLTIVIAGVRSEAATLGPVECAAKLESLSSSLRVFRADFDVMDHKIPPPKEFTDAELQHELSRLEEEAKRDPGTEVERFQREKRKELALRRAQEATQASTRNYRATLYVKGDSIRWEEPQLIVAYDGKKMAQVTNPTQPFEGTTRITPWVNVMPKFSIVRSQQIPFYGAIHPSMPMFACEDLKTATPVQSLGTGVWRIKPTNR